MDLRISINDEVYNHFLNNNYSRADIIAVHNALNNTKPGTQKFGKWIPTNDISKWGYKCSECEGVDYTNLGHFCKWCGIKMESEE